MYKIDNISIQDYFTLEDTSSYDVFIDTLKPKNDFNGKRCHLNNLTFDEVEVLKSIFNKPTPEAIKDLFVELFDLGSYEVSAEQEYLNTSVFDLFRAKNYLQQYILNVVKREGQVLAGIPDEKLEMINAGERLKAVSHLLTKMRLAEQFGKAPNEIGAWKYNTVFTLLTANKINQDIQREYQQIK